MAFEKIIDVTRLNRFKTKILELVYQKGDVYTKNEVDNKFSALETNIDWKESVATYSDITKTYPNPVDGWTVNVKDTDYTYRYNGTSWVAISANAIPKATQSVDGLMTKEDKTKLDGVATGAEVNQNAFSKVTVGSTTVAADSKTDTLTLVAGSNVTLTPDATNDKITITATDTNTHYASGTIVNNSTTATANTTTALTNGNVYLNHVENSAVKNSHKISGSGSTTVTSDISGNIVVTTPSDTKASTVSFTTSDVADGDATSWTSVSKLTSGITHKTFLERVSQMFKNIRYLYKMLGTTDISGIGDGTCSGAISSLNSNLLRKQDIIQIELDSSYNDQQIIAEYIINNYQEANKPQGLAFSVLITDCEWYSGIIYGDTNNTNWGYIIKRTNSVSNETISKIYALNGVVSIETMVQRSELNDVATNTLAYRNGNIDNALAVDLSNPDSVLNKPHTINSSTAINVPDGLAWGVREVLYIGSNAVIVRITGIAVDGSKNCIWTNIYNYGNWTGWQSYNYNGLYATANHNHRNTYVGSSNDDDIWVSWYEHEGCLQLWVNGKFKGNLAFKN